jgi:hypothetical protein
MNNNRKVLAAWGTTALATALVVGILPAPASAIGNNRTVTRGCGKNYVGSGYSGSGGAWAQTQHESGDCQHQLSVAFELSSGHWTPRYYGTFKEAYDYLAPALGHAAYGLHWGCSSCNVTKS